MMNHDIPLKTSVDVARIRRSCRVAEKTLQYLKQFIKPGITTLGLDSLACEFIEKNHALPSLKGYEGFPGCICTSVNNVASHGIPSDYSLMDGDIITVDVTVSIDGWHGDAAWTYFVGADSPDKRRLIKASWQATLSGIRSIVSGGHMGDIGNAIFLNAEKYGCSVMKEYVGHGIGRSMHEEPKVPHLGEKGSGIRIVPGMVFTVEPIITLGSPDSLIIEDGWTIITGDNSLSAQFEHTVAVFRDRIEILTLSVENTDDFHFSF
jgi:methionyl aminopeptidase